MLLLWSLLAQAPLFDRNKRTSFLPSLLGHPIDFTRQQVNASSWDGPILLSSGINYPDYIEPTQASCLQLSSWGTIADGGKRAAPEKEAGTTVQAYPRALMGATPSLPFRKQSLQETFQILGETFFCCRFATDHCSSIILLKKKKRRGSIQVKKNFFSVEKTECLTLMESLE